MDDSAGCISTAYRRACQLFARAAAGVASPTALAERIALLVEKDDYGVRHTLLEHVPKFVDSETIARLPRRRVVRFRGRSPPVIKSNPSMPVGILCKPATS